MLALLASVGGDGTKSEPKIRSTATGRQVLHRFLNLINEIYKLRKLNLKCNWTSGNGGLLVRFMARTREFTFLQTVETDCGGPTNHLVTGSMETIGWDAKCATHLQLAPEVKNE